MPTHTVEQIIAAMERLSVEDFNRLRKWFDERAAEIWDREIEADVAAGRFDAIADQAIDDVKAGRTKPL